MDGLWLGNSAADELLAVITESIPRGRVLTAAFLAAFAIVLFGAIDRHEPVGDSRPREQFSEL